MSNSRSSLMKITLSGFMPGLVVTLAVLCLMMPGGDAVAQVTQEGPSTPLLVDSLPVGISARLDQVVLPAPELKAVPIEDPDAAFILRLVEVYAHGSDFRYDFEFHALESGTYDLMDYLTARDGSQYQFETNLVVRVTSILPPGQIEPAPLSPPEINFRGGYLKTLKIIGVIWVIGLVLLVVWNRRKKSSASVDTPDHEPTIEELLQPLVVRAHQGTITDQEKAALERIVYRFWKSKLGLENMKMAEALQHLRRHEQAGQLLREMERWLHSPERDKAVDMDEILRPYTEGTGKPNQP